MVNGELLIIRTKKDDVTTTEINHSTLTILHYQKSILSRRLIRRDVKLFGIAYSVL